MRYLPFKKTLTIIVPLMLGLSLSGCGLSPLPTPEIHSYGILPITPKPNSANHETLKKKIIVHLSPVAAAAPYDSTSMFYSTSEFSIEPYHYNQWVAPPAYMIASTVAQNLNATAHFSVVYGNYIGNSQLNLTLTLNSLRQIYDNDKSPQKSTLSLTVLATLSDAQTGQTLSNQLFSENIPTSTGPQEMVKATNIAVQKLSQNLNTWLTNYAHL